MPFALLHGHRAMPMASARKQRSDQVFTSVSALFGCAAAAKGSKSALLEVELVLLLSCAGGCNVVGAVCARVSQPQMVIMMWFQHEEGRVYLTTVHYDVRAPATEGAEWRWACHIDLFSAKIWATLLCSPAQWCEK